MTGGGYALLLMNGGGLRVCECFHIWIHDIQPDPLNPDIAHVRVYHPAQGAAPKDFILASGKAPTNRAEYLAAKHPNYPPRHKASGSYHAGWKNPKLSNDNERYLHVHWFPSKLGKYFLIAWRMYLTQRISYGITAAKHPFLFASLAIANTSGSPTPCPHSERPLKGPWSALEWAIQRPKEQQSTVTVMHMASGPPEGSWESV